ncbi:DUF6087 family protein [Streptomyces sp. NPDC047049]|uniref:DUF6087 family protein n=1 Tax=Streptomyces sp. NPDC047049 TaxID=3156688 RepID=UPI003403484D
MDDEPLSEWAARRDRHRPAPGERKAVPLGDGQHAGHVDPGTPRVVEEWDGHQWTPSGVTADHHDAARETNTAAAAARVPLPQFSRLPPAPEPWRPTQVWRRP